MKAYPLDSLEDKNGKRRISNMAKTITEAQKQEKIAELNKKRDALSLLLRETEGTRKRDLLIAKIETIDEKIKKVRTGERFTRQEKRDMVAYSFIAP
jgi:multiple sugar transport system permease protein